MRLSLMRASALCLVAPSSLLLASCLMIFAWPSAAAAERLPGTQGDPTGAESVSCKAVPPATTVTEYSDIVYATVPRGDGQGNFGLMLDVHVPNLGNNFPALIFVHGGGWVSGARTVASGAGGMEEGFARYYAARGPFVVFNIDYRMPCDPGNQTLAYFDGTAHLSPRAAICNPTVHRHPVPLADVRTAIQWVKRHGAQYKADVTKIGILGDSAGGHLALLAATYDGDAPVASVKPRVAVGFSPPADFELAAELGLTNDGTPFQPVSMSASAHGEEFDECACLQPASGLGGLGWMNYGGLYCAARWNRKTLVGRDYEPGDGENQAASRQAWREASPRYWVGNTRPLVPDAPVYLFIGEGEARILEQEGEALIGAAAEVPTMAGSAFCRLSAQNGKDGHAIQLASKPVEPGCHGYDVGTSTQMNVLESSLRFLRENLPQCEGAPTPLASIGDVSTLEGSGTRFEFPVELSVPAPTRITFTYATIDGTARADMDYVPVTGNLVIAPGSTRGRIAVDVLDDPDVEEDETLRVRLTAATGATIDDGTGAGVILNDDVPGAALVSIGDAMVSEGDAGGTVMKFPVSLNEPSGETLTVDIAVMDGTAVLGEDYTSGWTQVSFAPGETIQMAEIQALGDVTDECDETFSVVLSNPVNGIILDDTGVGAILSDDYLMCPDADGDCHHESVCGGDDCDDTNPFAHRMAMEINDGIDNQCPGELGHGVTDEVSGTAGFFSATDTTRFSWPAQDSATLYEVVRSTDPAFTNCTLLPATVDLFVNETAPLAPDSIVFLLVRPGAPRVGSWGQGSSSAERFLSCREP